MLKIKNLPTAPPSGADRDEIEKETKKLTKRLAELQAVMNAEGKYSMLVVMQGMDASGKDGAVKKVFKYCSHIGIHLHSFKKPSKEEAAHDFLWRAHKITPQKGEIALWNRSHYEDVLIQRVHGWIDEERVAKRFAAINAFEDLLQFDNDTVIFKFFLNLSYDQQKIELQERIDEREKNFKYNPGDWAEREHWDKYMECYEDILNRCDLVPWTVVPVDARWYRDYVMAKAMVEKLEKLNMEYPAMEE